MENKLIPTSEAKSNLGGPREAVDAPPLIPSRAPEATRDDHRGASVLRREVRADGSIETRLQAFDRYRELGLNPPNPYDDPYYDA